MNMCSPTPPMSASPPKKNNTDKKSVKSLCLYSFRPGVISKIKAKYTVYIENIIAVVL